MRRFLPIVCLLAAACQQQAPSNPANQAGPVVPAGRAVAKGVDRHHAGSPLPDTVIKDPDGEDLSLTEFSGKPVLINLWATWCAPCVRELPTLDALAQRPGAPTVLSISQDMEPQPVVADFLARHHIHKLESYQDSENRLMSDLKVEVLPTTIFFDGNGRELWRYTGDNNWKSPAAAALLAEASPAAAR